MEKIEAIEKIDIVEKANPAEKMLSTGVIGNSTRTVATFKILREPPMREHLLLTFMLILLIAGVQAVAGWYSKNKAEEWARYLKYYKSIPLVYQPQPAVLTKSADESQPNASNTEGKRPPSSAAKSVAGMADLPSSSPAPAISPPPAGVPSDTPASSGALDKAKETAIEISFEGRRRIENQFQEITERARHHLKVATDFYTNYYQIISVMLVTGLLAAIALLSISKNGWSATNSYILTVFVLMTSATAYYGAYIPVFKIDQNVADNKSLYLQYVNLGNEVLSYLATKSNSKNQMQKDSEFIHHMDAELAKLNNIAIGFDYSKIPTYGGIFESAPKSSQPEPTATQEQKRAGQ